SQYLAIGLLGIIGVYHIVLFGLRRQERAPAWFAAFCFTIATRSWVMSRVYEMSHPASDAFVALRRLEFGMVTASAWAGFTFLAQLLPGGIWRGPFRVAIAASWVLLAMDVFAPESVVLARGFLIAFQLHLAFVTIFGVSAMVRDAIRAPSVRLLLMIAG